VAQRGNPDSLAPDDFRQRFPGCGLDDFSVQRELRHRLTSSLNLHGVEPAGRAAGAAAHAFFGHDVVGALGRAINGPHGTLASTQAAARALFESMRKSNEILADTSRAAPVRPVRLELSRKFDSVESTGFGAL
jgi:hypothetical protein